MSGKMKNKKQQFHMGFSKTYALFSHGCFISQYETSDIFCVTSANRLCSWMSFHMNLIL
jgi:hypothetical protein